MSTISASTTTTTALVYTADTTGTLVLQTGSTPTAAMTIGATQNIGIGTASPVTKLDVRTTAFTPTSSAAALLIEDKSTWAQGAQFYLNNAGTFASSRPSGALGASNSFAMWLTGGSILTNNPASSNGFTASSTAASAYQCGSGTHIWYGDTGLTAGNTYTQTERMRINTNGDLLVGTTSASFSIANRGNISLGGSAGSIVSFSAGNGYVYWDASDSRFEMWNVANSYIRFGTNNTERARIDSSGNLLVGTTDAGAASGNGVKIIKDRASLSGYNAVSVVSNANNTGYSTYELYTATGGTGYKFYVIYNGGIANFQANNSNISDRREKTNFAPAGDYLAKICAIPVQTFNYIDQDLEDDPGLTLGVVAQDVQAVAPELVTETKLGTGGDGEKRLAIYQTDLQYALMKCIQEQQAIIETLTNRITALEAK